VLANRDLTQRSRWRAALALPAGVLAVHQLRYLLAYGAGAGHVLRAHGDTYVPVAFPAVALLLAAASIATLARLARGSRDLGADRRPWWSIWLRTAAVLVAGFCLLELLEVAFEAGHPGFGSIFGDGGWWALPAAALVSGLLTLVVRGGRALLRAITAQRRQHLPRSAHASKRAPVVSRARRAALATCAAGRAPPLRRLPDPDVATG
jgi:hypothetical protein